MAFTTAFQADAFQNNAFQIWTGAVVAPPERIQLGGHGGWVHGHEIRWGRKRKRREEQIEEVASAVQQAVAAMPSLALDSAEDRRMIAQRLLAEQTLGELRKVTLAQDLAALIALEIEREDEEIILLM